MTHTHDILDTSIDLYYKILLWTFTYVHSAGLELLDDQNSPPDDECLPTLYAAGMQNLCL